MRAAIASSLQSNRPNQSVFRSILMCEPHLFNCLHQDTPVKPEVLFFRLLEFLLFSLLLTARKFVRRLSDLSPLSWWRMGDGDTSPTLTDNGSGGNDGTMTNFSTFSTDVPT